MKKRRKYASGSITVLLSLVMSTVLILTTACTELSRTALIKAQMVADCQNAMASILAEYNRPLLERYDIFGMDGAYGGTSFNSKKMEDRMKEYMAGLRGESGIALGYGEEKLTTDNYGFLTDKCGSEVRAQAITFMKKAYGLDILGAVADIPGITGEYEENEEEVREIASNDLGEDDGGILSSIKSMRNMGVLQAIMGFSPEVSTAKTRRGMLLSNRRSDLFKNSGVLSGSFTDKMLFQEYIMKKFTNYVNTPKNEANNPHTLKYEVEYIICGHEEDKENLAETAKKLVHIREVANFLYIQTDEAKKGEAELVATAICMLLLMPELIEVVKEIILAGWAYAESICDVRTLLRGGKVPLIKTAASWKTGLFDIVNPTGSGVLRTNEGLDYGMYLRVLLFMENEADKTGRALDIMELNVKATEGYANFGMDNCIFGFGMTGVFTINHIFGGLGRSKLDYRGAISYEMLEKR